MSLDIDAILALPADVRAVLAGVPGPGWHIVQAVGTYDQPTAEPAAKASGTSPPWPGALTAWWPGNPTAALAAVLDYDLRRAHERITDWLNAYGGDDHAAALGLIKLSLGGSHGT